MKMLKTGPRILKAKTPPAQAETARTTGGNWMKMRRETLDENPRCVMCEAEGVITPAKEVDHIVPLWAGGTDAKANRQGLCCECHRKKTALEASVRAGGVLFTGIVV